MTASAPGREFRAIFLSTSEPTQEDGETCNPTKSICDPYVFNTAITRAQSLVVSVGNPFILLREEQHMVKRYGNRGKCWSTYLQFCLEHDTLSIDPSLKVSRAEEQRLLEKLQELVGEQVPNTPTDTEVIEAEQTKLSLADENHLKGRYLCNTHSIYIIYYIFGCYSYS